MITMVNSNPSPISLGEGLFVIQERLYDRLCRIRRRLAIGIPYKAIPPPFPPWEKRGIG